MEIAVNLSVISFNTGQVPFAAFQELLGVTVSPLTMQSSEDHHRVSASVMKAEVQVKRRRQALHQDMVTLEEQQVDGEGETYGAGRFLGGFFKLFFYQLFSKPQGLHFRCLCVGVRYVCAV